MNDINFNMLPNHLLRTLVACIFFVSILGLMAGCKSVNAANHQQLQQIQQKAQMAKNGVIERKRSGGDVSEMLRLMSQVKPNIDNKDFDKAEAVLDEVLSLLETGDNPAMSSRGYSENSSDAYGSPEVVNIKGYTEDAMEPFVSRDGKYLFFNNLNDPKVNTELLYAEKIDELNYNFKGPVKGVNSSSLEGVPTLDENNKFCFVSTREFQKTRLTLFCGDFNDGEVTGLHTIGKSMVNRNGVRLNMGPELSPDGETLYYTESVLDTKSGGIPKSLNIKIATLNNGDYYTVSNSDDIFKNINTDALEYAPSISKDGLVLSFTRASELIVGNQSSGKDLRILVSTRKSPGEAFGVPEEISSIRGFVEGPTMLDNGNIIYFHKKDGSRFKIFRVTRNN
ncbi:MAG: hypothetical protein HKN08_03615 [Gammaproteobacteria bacterium]|nr:hypothetical protein [Gammaproteobacteria bacterium]